MNGSRGEKQASPQGCRALALTVFRSSFSLSFLPTVPAGCCSVGPGFYMMVCRMTILIYGSKQWPHFPPVTKGTCVLWESADLLSDQNRFCS